jgi:hypothetical protein
MGKNLMKSKQKKPTSSIILYVAASIIAILGVSLLISNVLLYRKNVAQYVAQGTDASVVTAQLIPAQLIPGIFEPIGIYLGIALILTCAGIINQKVSKCLAALTENEVCDVDVEVKALEEDNDYVKAEKAAEESEEETEVG